VAQLLLLRRPFAGFIGVQLDIRMLLPELLTRRATNNDSMSSPDRTISGTILSRFCPIDPLKQTVKRAMERQKMSQSRD
jgi:hypothetical protein